LSAKNLKTKKEDGEMRDYKSLKVICAITILMGIFLLSISAHAETANLANATALEKKLYQAALKEGKLEYWETLSMKEASVFIKEFNRKYPGIKVDYFEATSDVREEKYLAEYAAGRRTMDVTTIDQYDRFQEKGILMDVSDIIKDVKYPVKLCTKDLKGVTVEHVLIGTGYNTKLVQPKDVPRSWEDLLNPKWKGRKIGLENRFKLFIYNTPNWGQEKTVKYLNRMKEQNPIFTKGNSGSLTLLSAG
jgi:iron(III) transport system substrate-binding protein